MSPLTNRFVIRRRILHLWALFALMLSLNAFASGLDARLDRTRIAEGETVVLQLTAPGDVTGTPDPGPLERDFDLLDQSQSSRMNIVNGRSSSFREWQWVLAPKRTGKLIIPEIHLDRLTSAALSLEVLPAAQAAKLEEARPVLLEVEAQPQQPYVQGQVVYRVRILSRVPLHQASLSEPQAGDALIERLGEDQQSTTYRNGQQYQVIERRYAVFPQHSGKLAITAPVLSAQVPEPENRRGSMRDRLFGGDPFGNLDRFFGSDPFADMGGILGQSRPVQLRGRSIDLEVQPQPAGAPSPWLPAESLTLAETWSPSSPVFRVGEPVTRTLAITAQGLSAAQLPDLQPPAPGGVKVYPDKAQTETRGEGDTLVAQKILKSAWVPTQPGKLTLPEVQLPWWDTRTAQARVASLPAQTVEVLPAAAGAPVTPPAPVQQGTQAAAEPDTPVLENRASSPVSTPATYATASWVARLGDSLIRESGVPTGYWPWLAALLALGWLTSGSLWWRDRAARPVAGALAQAPARSAPNPAKFLAPVKQACNANDARAARQALLAWAAARWPDDPPERLETLALRLGPEALAVLRELDRVLYASGDQSWKGTSAWQDLEPLLTGDTRERDGNGQHSPLPPLYPHTA